MADNKSGSPIPGAPRASDLWQIVSKFLPSLRLAHQIPGRVRLKLDVVGLLTSNLQKGDIERLQSALGSIRGVRSIRLNLPARSCAVEYDSTIIPDAAWADLLAQRATPDAQVLIDILHEGYEETLREQL
ncbi:MAG: hypothetical protein U1E63_06785 [Burkholderiales bacterium]